VNRVMVIADHNYSRHVNVLIYTWWRKGVCGLKVTQVQKRFEI